MKPITPNIVESAAVQTADPVAVVEGALSRLPTDPGAIYEDAALAALRAIREKDEAAYARLCAKAKGHKTKLDKLTTPERDAHDQGIVTQTIAIAKRHCIFGHDADGRGIAIIDQDDIRQIWYVDSPGFHDWMRAAYFAETQSGISEMMLSTAIATLAAIGKYQGSEHAVYLRCAKHGDAYYIDLCDDHWRAIKVTADGWSIVLRPPTFFIRTKSMRPLPYPGAPSDLQLLWKYVNVPERLRLLVLAWLIDSYRIDTPFPILEFSGEQGTAKSTAQKRIRALIDPNKVMLRGRPNKVEDIYVGAANNWIVSFENLSHLSPEQQDALCTLATGGGFASRLFYTNGEEHVLETKRPVMINGINPVATQPDLIERDVNIEMSVIPPEDRIDEQTLEAGWEADAPAIFAGVLDLFAATLAKLPSVKLKQKFRMADYQLLGEALAQALGHPPGHFTTVYQGAVTEGIDRSLETYGVAGALQALGIDNRNRPWKGTVMELKASLDALSYVDRSNWPKSPRGLSGQLKRLAPGLRKRGISIERLGKGNTGSQLLISFLGTVET